MFLLVFALAAAVAASIHVALSTKTRKSKAAIAETYLVYFFFIFVGLMGVVAAYGHILRPVQTSASIGWLTSPYEYEVGMADLAIGVLGILSVWLRGGFWLATSIASLVSLWGDAAGHIRQMIRYNNHAPNNSGIFLYVEIVTPLLIFWLVLYQRRKTPASSPD